MIVLVLLHVLHVDHENYYGMKIVVHDLRALPLFHLEESQIVLLREEMTILSSLLYEVDADELEYVVVLLSMPKSNNPAQARQLHDEHEQLLQFSLLPAFLL